MNAILKTIFNELSFTEQQYLDIYNSLPAFPHGEGTDIELGIFVKPTGLDLDMFIFDVTLDYISNTGAVKRLSNNTKQEMINYINENYSDANSIEYKLSLLG